jgi:flagellar biogenesis protein FliO
MPYTCLATALSVADPDTLPAGGWEIDWTRYLLVCLGLLSLVLLGGMGLKRLAQGQLTQRAGRRSLQVLDLLPLGRRQRLAVVRCYDRTFVVGVGERELCLLGELEGELSPARPTAAPAAASAGHRARFTDLLRRLGEGAPAEAAVAAASVAPAAPTPAPAAKTVRRATPRPANAAAPTETVAQALRREGVLG